MLKQRLIQCWVMLSLWLTGVSAHADQYGGGLPWEGPLEKIMYSISGPVAKMLGVIVIVIAGMGIAFGEGGSGVRRLFQVVMGLAIAFSAASIVASLYYPAGGAF